MVTVALAVTEQPAFVTVRVKVSVVVSAVVRVVALDGLTRLVGAVHA